MSSQFVQPRHPKDQKPVSSISPYTIRASGLRVSLLTDPPGIVEMPALRNTIISIHVGPSVQMLCRRGGRQHRGTAVHGDIDIIPAGTPGAWELTDKDTALVLGLSPELLSTVAEHYDLDPGRVEIRNRFQVRDPQLENIAWALKAEMESGYPCGRIYVDSLAVSVAARLLRFHSSSLVQPEFKNRRLSDRKFRQVLEYIEANLDRNISLADIAGVAGLSVSHFKSLFRESAGVPAHQYLIRRRVERAKNLIAEDRMPISQVAFEAGFAHQSHLARHMRRLLGVSPKALRKTLL
jgi:AraC family transcriptional regulator